LDSLTEILDIRGIKAETLISILGAHEKLNVKTKGTFARNYAEDLIKIEENPDATRLTIARDGIFHLLPQGLFFDENLLTKNKGSNYEFEKVYRELKRKKKEALTFFRPFDTLFFNQTFKLEKVLNKLAEAGNDTLIDAFLDKSGMGTDNKYIAKLKKLIPFASQLRGNLPLLVDTLKVILATPKIEIKTIAPLHKRLIIHKEGLTKIEYHAIAKDMKPFFDLFCHWFIPVEQQLTYRIKDYSRPFKIDGSLILDYNTHF